MKTRAIIILLTLIGINTAGALGLADFVPGFLVPANVSESSGADDSLPVQPLVDVKRNSSETDSWYCAHNKQKSVGNVFCNKNNSSDVVGKALTYESSPQGDTNQVVDNSVVKAGGIPKPIGPSTTSNQFTLQDQQLKNAFDKTQNNFSVPIQPSNDVKMNINQQQIQFNIQY